ncbi:MAG: 6,7-dimethyl-8-ribityllumazine synthase [Armatimonadota bacterium]|nr:6,7-dimethyl-8-ribityllumazine synthase [Armatimonadota bacterium]MDR5676304.1 6,7-dimethyl-8-ribityllumazine synthase [Armatimonadota bacterium]MDR5690272.1 6,7-dimethyl-8-ribityllumazine synthase [Armatimonadota bacterium]MDR7387004.1 6,7-dimethyl-8-ribityllumazine synthase [Armatimonadota bacterium]MDR7388310.1 6,7-dimethyl-8-ribityllumazine synthase [Armatimonadota bacterium]
MRVRTFEGSLDGRGLRVGVVASRFNEATTRLLVEGALDGLRRCGVEEVDVAWVPGAFEIPLVAARLARCGRYDAVVCVGAVVRGQTPHFEYVAGHSAAGIARAALDSGVPVLYGVVTADDPQQAAERAGGKAGNRGRDAALAAVEMATLLRQLRAEVEAG